MLSKREVMKFLGFAPFSAVAAKESILSVVNSATGKAVTGLGGLTPAPVGVGIAEGSKAATLAESVFGKGGLKAFNEFTRNLADEQDVRGRMKVSGIEPDIACLKSTSHAYKVLRQRDRDLEIIQMWTLVNRFRYGGE